LRVELRGPAGNPSAVGALITVRLASGSMQTSEVYAGSGYYSQSTAAAFFGYTASNPPQSLRIRWPSGVITEQPVPSQSVSLVVSAPVP
jgi:hypothetical protein